MSSQKKGNSYLSDYQVYTEAEKNFQLIPCNRRQYISVSGILSGILVILLLLVFLADLNEWMVVYSIIMSFLVIFITPVVWHKVFQRFIKYSLVPALEKYHEVKDSTNAIKFIKDNVGKLLGLHFDSTLTYYLEAEPQDIDLSKSRVLLQKAFDVTTTAIGFSFIATMITTWFIPINAENWYTLLYLAIGFAFASPLLISPLMPIMWTLEDSAVKSIDDQHKISQLGFRMRERVFDRIIGKGGLIFGFSFVLRQITALDAEIGAFSSFMQFLITLIVYLSMILIMGLPCLLTTMRYLQQKHQENVTLTRNILKTVLPIGLTVVKRG